MLDIRMFREYADVIRADHDKRGLSHESIDEVIRLDEAWRKARYDADQLRRKRNEAARGMLRPRRLETMMSSIESRQKWTKLLRKLKPLGHSLTSTNWKETGFGCRSKYPS